MGKKVDKAKVIQPGTRIGRLEAKWCYGPEGARTWKCVCECGGVCYVKEEALLRRTVRQCENCYRYVHL